MTELSKEFTKEEFNTEAPYLLLYEHRDEGFYYMQLFNALEANAQKVGFKRFVTMAKAYFAQYQDRRGSGGIINNITNFNDQPIELYTGDWIADDTGIMRRNERQGVDVACSHPILPVERLINIDDEKVRMKLMFRRDYKKWQEVIVSKSTMFNSKALADQLSDMDVSVSEKNAKYLVQYLQDVDDINHDLIPIKQSVSRLGWSKDGLFSPYAEEVVFDGSVEYKRVFESVHNLGDFNVWREAVNAVRKTNSPARIILAASFASVVLRAIDKMNFVVHLWGGTEVGKTVALLLATSVWGNPGDSGGYMQTFNGTAVSIELLSGIVNNLPLILDEFQLVKDKKNFEYSIYLLTQGMGRTRGAKNGGLRKTETWKNCAITSGETPITHSSSGGGAVNRILEIECQERLFDDPSGLLEIIRGNYGHAGKIFVTLLDSPASTEKAKEIFKRFYRELGQNSTEKQTMAAAVILTADALATEWIFGDSRALTIEDIEKYLHSKESVDVGARAFEYIYDFCVSNSAKFDIGSDPCYGKMLENEVRIMKGAFERICDEGGFNPRAVLSWMDQAGKLSKDPKGNLYKVTKINGKPARCACIDIRESDDFVPAVQEELPFH